MDQFTIRIAKPKGHSMFANNPIRRGARIIAETPLLWIRTGVSLDLFDEDAFVSAGDRSGSATIMHRRDQLSDQQKVLFDNLCFQERSAADLNSEKGSRRDPLTNAEWTCLSRFQTNCFNIREGPESQDEKKTYVVFEKISRINHSCKPNAAWQWHSILQQGVIQALQPIPKGTEITINYCAALEDTLKSRVDRRAHLRDTWGFDCTCSVCKSGPIADQQRQQARDSHRQLLYLQRDLEESRRNGTDDGTCAQVHQPQRRILRLFDDVCTRFKGLGILDQGLSEIYNKKLEYHEARADREEGTTWRVCGRCQLVTHPCAHLDAAIASCHEMEQIDIRCYGVDHPNVKEDAEKRAVLLEKRQVCKSPEEQRT